MSTQLTPGLIDAAVALSLDRSLPDEQRFEQFRQRSAACRDVLNDSAVSGELLERRGWQRWHGNKLAIWIFGTARIMWTVDKGLVLFAPGKMITKGSGRIKAATKDR